MSEISPSKQTLLVFATIASISVLLASAFSWPQLSATAQQAGQQLMGAVPSSTAAPLTTGSLTPERTYYFNNNIELNTGTNVTVATLAETSSAAGHRLTIQYSGIGAIQNTAGGPGALMYLGCFIDGKIPCIGSNTDPATTPPGWVNALSTNYPSSAAWDSGTSYTWWSPALGSGTHTVTIKAAVGNSLFGFGGTGTLFEEARNLIVTVSVPS